VLERGLPALLVEDGGARITTLAGAGDDETAAAIHALVNHLGASEAHFQSPRGTTQRCLAAQANPCSNAPASTATIPA
jgi:hypothetical protein